MRSDPAEGSDFIYGLDSGFCVKDRAVLTELEGAVSVRRGQLWFVVGRHVVPSAHFVPPRHASSCLFHNTRVVM